MERLAGWRFNPERRRALNRTLHTVECAGDQLQSHPRIPTGERRREVFGQLRGEPEAGVVLGMAQDDDDAMPGRPASLQTRVDE